MLRPEEIYVRLGPFAQTWHSGEAHVFCARCARPIQRLITDPQGDGLSKVYYVCHEAVDVGEVDGLIFVPADVVVFVGDSTQEELTDGH